MKNIIIVIGIFMTISLLSCTSEKNPQGVMGSTQWVKEDAIKKKHTVLTIDGCEYIHSSVSYGQAGGLGLTHKGNCSNPIHKCNCKH